MLPFLVPPRVYCSTIHRSATFARRQVPSTSTSCSRRFAITREDQTEDLEGTEGEFDEPDPWSHFQMDGFDSVGGGAGRKGGRSRPGTSTGSSDAWLTGEGLQFKRPGEGKPNWLGVNTVRPRRGVQFFWCADLSHQPFPLNPTFRPPAPIGEHVKQEIWEKFVGKREVYTPKTLSLEYRLSVPRIEAIIRLKALEYLWRKVCVQVP